MVTQHVQERVTDSEQTKQGGGGGVGSTTNKHNNGSCSPTWAAYYGQKCFTRCNPEEAF